MTQEITTNINKNINLGFAVEDAIQGWIFTDVIDYGEQGNGTCHIGHPIRYGYIVTNPTNPSDTHIYGSECICKFWIAQKYKTLDPAKFKELYKQYHPLFVKFSKLIYLTRHYGVQFSVFPQNLDDLQTSVAELKDLVDAEKNKRKTAWNAAQAAYNKTHLTKTTRRKFLAAHPEFATLYHHMDYTKLQSNAFYTRFAKDLITKFERYGAVILSTKQLTIIKEINAVLLAVRSVPVAQPSTQTNGNPDLAKKLQTICDYETRTWLKTDFLPSLIQQLKYKADLSDKQKAVLQKHHIDIEQRYATLTTEIATKTAELTQKLDLIIATLNLIVLNKVIRANPYVSKVECSRYPDYRGTLDDTDIDLLYQYLTRTGCGLGLNNTDANERIKITMLRGASWAAGW